MSKSAKPRTTSIPYYCPENGEWYLFERFATHPMHSIMPQAIARRIRWKTFWCQYRGSGKKLVKQEYVIIPGHELKKDYVKYINDDEFIEMFYADESQKINKKDEDED